MNQYRVNKNLFLVFLLVVSITLISIDVDNAEAKVKKKAKVTKVAKKKVVRKKTSTKKKRRKKNVAKAVVPKISEKTPYQIVFSDTLQEGIIYKKYLIGSAEKKVATHIIEADISNPENQVAILKAKNQINELEKLQIISRIYDSLNLNTSICAAVNANFWRAGSNAPIGAVVVNGEVVEMNAYKNWSSAMFDSRNRMYIDRFSITGTITSNKGLLITIDQVNRRSDSNQIVLYNQFGGDSIPYVSPAKLAYSLEAALIGIEDKDTTDLIVDTSEVMRQVQLQRRMEAKEYSMPKLVLKYLTPPGVNKRIRCKVIALDSFTVKTSPKTCILSLNHNFPTYKIPKIGDTLTLKFQTNIYQGKIFQNAVCGTPRLVRNGVANHEAEIEGSRSRRFIGSSLPRTAIGVNKANTKIYLVVVEPGSVSKNTIGANLKDMAEIMNLLGCQNAMNLDGGGSSILSVNYQNQIKPDNPDGGRKISVGLAIIKKFKNKYHREALKVVFD